MQNEVIRHADMADLDALAALEAASFPPSEAADREAFSIRLEQFPHCFWMSEVQGQLCAMVCAMTTDTRDLCDAMYEGTTLYAENGKWLMLLGVATAPACRHQGYASRLLRRVIGDAQARGCDGIVLACKAELIPFYAQHGFVDEGLSRSQHGGAVWYQMRLDLAAYITRAILQGEELPVFLHGREFLLYGWEQCDGYVLNLADAQGEIRWQTPPMPRRSCADSFLAYMKNQ